MKLLDIVKRENDCFSLTFFNGHDIVTITIFTFYKDTIELYYPAINSIGTPTYLSEEEKDFVVKTFLNQDKYRIKNIMKPYHIIR